MPKYSVATTKDQLSSLIDKALAGEEVVITRHGKPTVALRVVHSDRPEPIGRRAWLARLAELRAKLPTMSTSYVEAKGDDEGERCR